MVWKGTTDLVQGKENWEYQASKTVVTTDFQGPYETCFTDKPEIGESIGELPPTLKVTNIKITELDGGAGRIDLILEATEDDSGYSFAPLGEPIYEIDFVEVQRPLETHESCGFLTSGRDEYKDGVMVEDGTGGKQRTWEDWADLIDNDYDDGGGWTLAEYKSLKEKGQDSYVVFQPLVRVTTIHLSRPTDLGYYSGAQQTPPGRGELSRRL